MTNERLRRITKQAFNLAPSANWIAQDPDDGDWYAYEAKPIFSFTQRWWIPSEVSGYAYICNTEVLPNEPVIAYEISKILASQ